MTVLEAVGAVALADLPRTIDREHRAVLAGAEATLHHAIRAGEALLIAKAQVPEGEWEQWVETHCEPAYSTAKHYIRLATYKHVVLDAPQTLNPSRALRYLRGLPAVNGTRVGSAFGDEIKQDARRMVREGASRREIARTLGVGKTTVDRWVNPSAARDGESAARRNKRKRAAEAAALKREERMRLARRQGGSIAQAYALLRRTQAELQRALDAEQNREARRALSRAYSALTEAEEQFGCALPVTEGHGQEVA